MRNALIVCLAFWGALSTEAAAPRPAAPGMNAAATADMVIENARIWSDGLPALAEFAAIDDGRFVYVGARDEAFIGPETKRIEAGGRVVLPGLIDSHIHMLGGGRQASQLQLRAATDKMDFIQRVGDWAAALPKDAWILGGRWSVESWESPEQPTKDWIDPVTGEHPLFLPRMDGHSALVNSAALKLAGIDKNGPQNPEGGVIDREADSGEPTGILRESAMQLVARLIPDSSIDDDVKALKTAIEEALRHGITAVSDIAGIDDLPVYERLANSSSDLKLRFFLYPTADDWSRALPAIRAFPNRRMWVQINGCKAYLDGSLGSRTAMMRAPFLNNEPHRHDWRGIWREGVDDGQFQLNIETAAREKLQPITHAIGDQANHFLLDVLFWTYSGVEDADLKKARARSEHTQHLLPEDIARFAELGVIASMQPYHKADDGRYAESYIGEERCRSSYAFKSLIDGGANVAFGSDWPVVSLNPFLGIEAAVTGRTLDGKVWQAQESISVEDALRCYTSGGAYAAFAEHEIGRIAPGYRADFVIWDRSPFDENVEWSAIKPMEVYVEGRKVFAAE